MANVDRPNGLRPVKHFTGAPYNGQANRYSALATDSSVIMVGDIVQLDSTDSGNATAYPAVKRLAAGDSSSANAVGVVVGFTIDPTALNTPQYRAASTARTLLVADSPDIVFEINEDADGGALANTSLGLNAAVTTTAGSTTTGSSGMELDASTAATEATLPLKIVGFSDREDNERGVANAKVLVTLNKHLFRGGQVGQ
jgi:hypothetical protein